MSIANRRVPAGRKADVTLRIAPVFVDIAKNHTVSTIGYNGSLPGPLAPLKEVVYGKPAGGLLKDVALVKCFRKIEPDVVPAMNGLTLFHCHRQLHMDYGFKLLFKFCRRSAKACGELFEGKLHICSQTPDPAGC